jgi:hypothetical protein
MGHMCHHAILVTTCIYKLAAEAHAEASRIFGEGIGVTSLTEDTMNGYRSFCVVPDGSKEFWAASDTGDAKRAEFIAWCNRQRHSDGSTSLKWVEIQLGDDDGEETGIVASWSAPVAPEEP